VQKSQQKVEELQIQSTGAKGVADRALSLGNRTFTSLKEEEAKFQDMTRLANRALSMARTDSAALAAEQAARKEDAEKHSIEAQVSLPTLLLARLALFWCIAEPPPACSVCGPCVHKYVVVLLLLLLESGLQDS
jgi:hypothetical protein